MIRRVSLTVVGITVAVMCAGTLGINAAPSDDDWHKFCSDQQPTQGEWDALPFIMTFRDLPAHCLEDGLKTRILWADVGSSVPLDVTSVAIDVEEPKEIINLELLPRIELNPIVR